MIIFASQSQPQMKLNPITKHPPLTKLRQAGKEREEKRDSMSYVSRSPTN